MPSSRRLLVAAVAAVSGAAVAQDVGSTNAAPAKSSLRHAMALEADGRERQDFSLGMQHELRGIGRSGAELRSGVALGAVNVFASEWRQPLDGDGRWYAAPRGLASRADPDLVLRDLSAAESVQELGVGGDLGRRMGDAWDARLGLDRTWTEIDGRLGDLTVPDPQYDEAAARLRLATDTTDDPLLPNRGSALRCDLRHADTAFGGDWRYDRTDLEATHTVAHGPFVVTPIARWSATWSGELPPVRQPSLGGFLNLSGLPRNSDPAANAAVAAVAGRVRLDTSALLLDVPVWFGGSLEAGASADDRAGVLRDPRLGGSVFLAVATPHGAGVLGAGFAEGEGVSLFLFFGQGR
jgi:NTE family protein